MASKKVMLTIPESVFNKLKKQKKTFGYSSIQEVIMEILRDKLVRVPLKRGKVGRPRKLDEIKILTSKQKVFSKKGVKIPI